MPKSAFSQAFSDSAPADIAAFSDGEGVYTSPAGAATSGVPYAIDREPADELDHNLGITEAQRATIHIATADVASPEITGTFTDADSVLWAVESVEIDLGIAALGVVQSSDVEISAAGGHRMESTT